MSTPSQSFASHTDYFMKIGTEIKGDATDSKHKGELQLLSWSWGEVQQGASAVAGTGAGAGRVNMQDFCISKHMDSATPFLFQACASGQHFAEVTLTCQRAGGDKQEFFKVIFNNVLISSYQVDGSNQSTIPIENFSLNFAKIQFTYSGQDEKGAGKGAVTKGFDGQTNAKF
jgi:type VI secretion system secreted protein Hcp